MSDDGSETYRAYIWGRAAVDVDATSGEEAIEKAYAKTDLGDLSAERREALFERYADLQEVDGE